MSSGVTNNPDLSFLNLDSRDNNAPVANRDHRRPRGRSRLAERRGEPQRVIVPFWDGPDGDLWDRITLGSRQWSGLVTIEGKGVAQGVDKRRARGSDHTRLVLTGYEHTEFKVKLLLWTEEHLGDFELLVSEVHPLNNPGLRNAIDVYHPALALLLISRAVVTEVGFLKPGPEHGTRECELTMIEYRAPTARNATHRVNVNTAPIGGIDIDPRFRTEQDDPSGAPAPSTTNAGP